MSDEKVKEVPWTPEMKKRFARQCFDPEMLSNHVKKVTENLEKLDVSYVDGEIVVTRK